MIELPKLVDSRLDFQDHVATLTLLRDDVRNALTGTALVDDICAVCDWVNANDDVRCLVVIGDGKAFSSGGNVQEMRYKQGIFSGAPAQLAANYRRGIQRMTLAVSGVEVPVIAAVNGAAVGAGCDLACMADIRLGSEYARFAEIFINLGIIPGDGGTWFLQRLVGYQRAAELTFSGRFVDAKEALSIGLVLAVYPADQLLAEAHKMAAGFASKPPQALRETKRLLKAAQRLELPDLLQMSALAQSTCHHSQDHSRALDTLASKEKTVYHND